MPETGARRQPRGRSLVALVGSQVGRRRRIAEIVADPERAARRGLGLSQELCQLCVVELAPALRVAHEPFLARGILEAKPTIAIAIRQVGPVAFRADLSPHLED